MKAKEDKDKFSIRKWINIVSRQPKEKKISNRKRKKKQTGLVICMIHHNALIEYPNKGSLRKKGFIWLTVPGKVQNVRRDHSVRLLKRLILLYTSFENRAMNAGSEFSFVLLSLRP